MMPDALIRDLLEFLQPANSIKLRSIAHVRLTGVGGLKYVATMQSNKREVR